VLTRRYQKVMSRMIENVPQIVPELSGWPLLMRLKQRSPNRRSGRFSADRAIEITDIKQIACVPSSVSRRLLGRYCGLLLGFTANNLAPNDHSLRFRPTLTPPIGSAALPWHWRLVEPDEDRFPGGSARNSTRRTARRSCVPDSAEPG